MLLFNNFFFIFVIFLFLNTQKKLCQTKKFGKVFQIFKKKCYFYKISTTTKQVRNINIESIEFQ